MRITSIMLLLFAVMSFDMLGSFAIVDSEQVVYADVEGETEVEVELEEESKVQHEALIFSDSENHAKSGKSPRYYSLYLVSPQREIQIPPPEL